MSSMLDFNADGAGAYSVTAITALIKQTLESGFRKVWVTGEVSNFKCSAAGHWYFTLKDSEAQIGAVMFRGRNAAYQDVELRQGLQVRVYGDVSVYAKGGNYQIICSRLEKAGLGELQLKFLQLKEELYKAGWFDPARKKPLPFLPERIALVTSPTGAAIRDMLRILFTRFPNLRVLLYPVPVQGNEAAPAIAAALSRLNQGDLGVDLIITGRGGGAMEDLWAFNERVVAEAIYHSRIPVISAVGHEVDFTIADFVADVRAETPSSAAVMAVPSRVELLERLQVMAEGIQSFMDRRLERLVDRWRSLCHHYALREPLHGLRQLEQQIDDYEARMTTAILNTLARYRERVAATIQRLDSLSPFQVLERGYAILEDPARNRTVRSVGDAQAGKELIARLADGTLRTRVLDIQHDGGRSQ